MLEVFFWRRCSFSGDMGQASEKKNPAGFSYGTSGKNRTKSLMRCYVYWANMDKDIADMVDSCKGCTLAAKALTIKCKPLPETVQPWQRIHVDFADPLDDQY